MTRLLMIAALLACASAHAQEPARFDAQAALQRAQVGTYSARLTAKPAKVPTRGRKARPADFERMRCFADPAAPETIICRREGSP